jgi:ADP-ribosylglycohydrolase
MLVEIAIADAFAAPYEFVVDDKFIDTCDELVYKTHPTRKEDLTAGEYTDDTQMSIAIVRHMLNDKPTNQFYISECFLGEYERYPIDGYARGFKKFLDGCTEIPSNKFITDIIPNSTRNGSVMRAVPIGLLPKIEDVVSYAITQASVTHCTMSGINGAVAVALAAHYYYHNIGSPKALIQWLRQNGVGFQHVEGPIPCEALHTAFAAIKLSMLKDGAAILKKSVKLKGDTDSVAAVALGLRSLWGSLELPDHLYDGLSSRGRRTIEDLRDHDKRLMEKYPRATDVIKTRDMPYINGEYNEDYGDDRICKCGHPYYRHFDTYDDMRPVGCKYCDCHEFVEAKSDVVV